jgi:SagB-type dehydrogenase family enzyme
MESVRIDYRFNPDVTSVEREGNRITLNVAKWRPLSFTPKTTALADAVVALNSPGASLAELRAIASNGAGGADAAVAYYIERFARGRLLAWNIVDEDGEVARVEALASRWQPRLDPPPAGKLHLCRFAYMRRSELGIVLESGLTRARVRLQPRGIAALAELLAEPKPSTPGSFASALWQLGFVDLFQADEDEARRCWEFHDLLTHESSRINRDTPPVGGNFRFEAEFAAPIAIKPSMAGDRIALQPVDPAGIRQRSASLDAVQARRQSIRAFAAEAISIGDLSEFLWRVARTTSHLQSDHQDLISRPYPAGGMINELEFYVVVRRCEGLEAALYHYDSHGHFLVRLAGSEGHVAKFMTLTAAAMGLGETDQRPDLLIILASRLPRLAWKYQGMAYRTTLLNVGIVFDQMYLVATDMGLAPCANGTGDSRVFAEATGLDPFTETAVGEFILSLPSFGRRPSS